MRYFKRLLRRVVWLLVLFPLLPTLTINWLRIPLRHGPDQFRVEMAGLRQDGLPDTPEKFQHPLPPPDLNAAPDYVQLEALLKAHPIDDNLARLVNPPGRLASLTPRQEQDLRALFVARRDVMALIYRAARKPRCVFRRDWSQGAMCPLPEFAPMRTASRLINAESYLLARKGQLSEAVSNQAAGFRLAQHAAEDPLLIGFLVGNAIEAVTLSGMQQIMRIAGPNPEVDDLISRAIDQGRPGYSLSKALSGEVASALVINRWIRTDGLATLLPVEHGVVKGAIDRFAIGGKAFDREYADSAAGLLLCYDRLLLHAASLPDAQRRLLIVRITNEAKQLGTKDTYGQLVGTLTAGQVAVTGPAQDKLDQTHDRESVALAAARVLAYRGRHGVYPPALQAVLGKTPMDHFVGDPLMYRAEGHGFVIYSAWSPYVWPGHLSRVTKVDFSKGEFAAFNYP